MRAAEDLGVDRKTLWRCQRAAELPPRFAETLERMLLERAVAAMEEDRERIVTLEERVAELEGQLAAALAVVNGGGIGAEAYDVVLDELRRELSQEMQRLERRLGMPAPAPAQGSGNAPGGGFQTSRAGIPAAFPRPGYAGACRRRRAGLRRHLPANQ